MGAAPFPPRLGHVGITTAASVEGTAYYGQGQPLQPTPALPSEAQQWAVEKFLRALVPPLNPLARQRENGLWRECDSLGSLFTYLMFGALQSKILLNECATCEQREVSVAMQGRPAASADSEHPGPA